jgi:hypothetical protein
MSNQSSLWHPKNHPTLTGQNTQNWALPAQLISHQKVTIYPATHQQKVTYAGKTAQITERADKAWAVAHADLFLQVA